MHNICKNEFKPINGRHGIKHSNVIRKCACNAIGIVL